MILETARLVLRAWSEEDKEPFARLNADPRVMEFMPAPLSREESDRFVDRIVANLREQGFGLYAMEHRADAAFIGFVGLATPSFAAHFTPCVEIGWRLAATYWNQGLATEGARAVVNYAVETLQLPELVSFTTVENVRSRRVMEKLGMTRDPAEDFEHPRLPDGHPLRRHVLYRLSATDRTSLNTAPNR
jgi:RimJ/RimL family protein N-acetyltransferase